MRTCIFYKKLLKCDGNIIDENGFIIGKSDSYINAHTDKNRTSEEWKCVDENFVDCIIVSDMTEVTSEFMTLMNYKIYYSGTTPYMMLKDSIQSLGSDNDMVAKGIVIKTCKFGYKVLRHIDTDDNLLGFEAYNIIPCEDCDVVKVLDDDMTVMYYRLSRNEWILSRTNSQNLGIIHGDNNLIVTTGDNEKFKIDRDSHDLVKINYL